MKVLITSGGCKVPIDDVRSITNFSTGRYGAEILDAFWWQDLYDPHEPIEIIFFHEKGSETFGYDSRTMEDEYDNGLKITNSLTLIEYKDYFEYLKVKDLIQEFQPDIIVSAAAISDYIVDKTDGKISSDKDEIVIRLKRGEKVIKSFRELAPNAMIVGFKLLVSPTDQEKETAIGKVFTSGVDVVVYNDLTELRKGNSYREFHNLHEVKPAEIKNAESLVENILSMIKR